MLKIFKLGKPEQQKNGIFIATRELAYDYQTRGDDFEDPSVCLDTVITYCYFFLFESFFNV